MTTSKARFTSSSLICSETAHVWLLLGMQAPTYINLILRVVSQAGLDNNIWSIIALAIFRKIWDSRNARVFCNESHLSTP